MKKIALSVLSSLALFVILITPNLALASDQQNYYASLPPEKLAYSDLDAAPEEWKDAILEARNSIIYSASWTVDGQVSYERPDGTIEELPEFSDLFPGWDVPKLNENVRKEQLTKLETQDFQIQAANYVGFVYLFEPSNDESTLPFYTFFSSVNRVTMQADSLPGTSYNGGYTDLDTGQDVGYVNYVSEGGKIYLNNPKKDTAYGARASTYSTEGYAQMSVVDDPK
ncbi:MULTISPECIES: hypothetical protein [unclassified Paenibacillus]|uniref:hypothetical protein n=1 Tax=unclassified Paenibacillus TaxID=185978 RepID=UPI001C115E32|nr:MULTISPECIES: hypothetical protein [unclassified Paenibacillus]MBU5445514.1 hypothetical protein [Paenibacillus sp. MSJ-34]CAH0122362.1 hypothetical protein PAE9249_04912 [Paenibacillus sp. CECT 9249]